MASSQLALSKQSPHNSPSKIRQRRAQEIKRKLFRTRLTDLKCKTKKVNIANPMKKIIICDSPDYALAKSSAMERAQHVQENLETKFPSFIKHMLPSHVTGGFWLSFPKQFCDLNLPKHDDRVVLVDQNEEEYETKYLANKNGLSGGWRRFSIAHKLVEGDVLVFQLIKSCKLKVYIVRVNGLDEIDGAIGLLNLYPRVNVKPMDADQMELDLKIWTIAREKCTDGLPLAFGQDDIQDQEKGAMKLETADLGPAADQSENDIYEHVSEVWEGIRFSESVVEFEDVKSIMEFNVHVGGLIIDSEMSTHLRNKYYELCCSQQSYLHENLLDGLNCKLAAGIISETINIADAIRASKLGTLRDNLKTWDRTLKAFEDLGMKVGFLRSRLNKLVSLSSDGSSKIVESKRLERVQVEEDMKNLESEIFDTKEKMRTLDAEIEAMQMNGKRLELLFQEEANAPW